MPSHEIPPLPTSSSSSPSLAFEIGWSSARCALLATQCLICIGIPWLVPYWPLIVRILLSVATLSFLAVGLKRAGWWGSERIVRVTWQQSGEWVLRRASTVPAHPANWVLLDDSYVSAWLMVLRWRSDESSASLVVLPGDISTHDWRQWQARLKLQGNHQRDSNLLAR